VRMTVNIAEFTLADSPPRGEAIAIALHYGPLARKGAKRSGACTGHSSSSKSSKFEVAVKPRLSLKRKRGPGIGGAFLSASQ